MMDDNPPVRQRTGPSAGPMGKLRQLMASGTLICDVDVPAEVFEMSKWAYYESVKRGTAPVVPILVGRRQRYRVADILRAVGLEGQLDSVAAKALADDGPVASDSPHSAA